MKVLLVALGLAGVVLIVLIVLNRPIGTRIYERNRDHGLRALRPLYSRSNGTVLILYVRTLCVVVGLAWTIGAAVGLTQ